MNLNGNVDAERYPARHRGFGLVELLIAMAIGLLIALGAERLFMIGIQNQQATQRLSQRQAVLSYLADSLIGDIRRAIDVTIENDDEGEVVILTLGDGDERTYRWSGDPDSEDGLSLYVDGQPVLNGFSHLNVPKDKCETAANELCPVTITFENNKEITLVVMNRNQSMGAL
ncbi:MAG: prepilin-type N-terminal cleavage/methylation domain-containing protein [Pseudomonadota bacterium]|nr:prepilin-type N-terminal cleavage/methylation domain-containing protein [Pseudomonadota bacterium]MED5499424.1 prepilin-type N-terminal cleavage/methylation domain-containing protein [Pseudomonadota bacterium]